MKWRKVRIPIAWKPEPGDELIGKYVKSVDKEGQYGEYKEHYIKVGGETYFVTGVTCDKLFSLVSAGDKVKLKFVDYKKCKTHDGLYKVYELYTEQAIEPKLVGKR